MRDSTTLFSVAVETRLFLFGLTLLLPLPVVAESSTMRLFLGGRTLPPTLAAESAELVLPLESAAEFDALCPLPAVEDALGVDDPVVIVLVPVSCCESDGSDDVTVAGTNRNDSSTFSSPSRIGRKQSNNSFISSLL